jgi:hypothetical protein
MREEGGFNWHTYILSSCLSIQRADDLGLGLRAIEQISTIPI